MAKKRIGELRGKAIIEGDKNLVTKNETHISEINTNKKSGFGSMGIILHYYAGSSADGYAGERGCMYDIATGEMNITTGEYGGDTVQREILEEGTISIFLVQGSRQVMIPNDCEYSEDTIYWYKSNEVFKPSGKIYVRKNY